MEMMSQLVRFPPRRELTQGKQRPEHSYRDGILGTYQPRPIQGGSFERRCSGMKQSHVTLTWPYKRPPNRMAASF